MEIYTSYFAKTAALKAKDIVPIAISLYPPKWFQGSNISTLAPKRYMLDDKWTDEQYTEFFIKDVLEKLDLDFLFKTIETLSYGKPVALLCFEKPGDFCHRHIVADWLKEKTGVCIEEYKFEEFKKPEVVQGPTLFD